MAFIDGAAFKCYIHDFETMSIDEWNNHCFGNDEHTEQGSAPCTVCGISVEFTDLPFHKIGRDGSKNISLKCEECESKTTGKVKRMTTKK